MSTVPSIPAAGVIAALALLAACAAPPAAGPEPVQAPDQREDPAADAPYVIPGGLGAAAFAFSDPAAFAVDVVDGDVVLTAKGGAAYEPPVRSPRNIAWLDTCAFGDFVLDVEMQQTGREYGHRDLCVFFAHQAPDRFYYVHLATAADPNAHSVFLVDRAPRRGIATSRTDGVDWGPPDLWHRVRVVRQGARIEVFFDDLEMPVMTADDETLGAGRLGLGSFDDEGRFRQIRIRGERVARPATAPFAR